MERRLPLDSKDFFVTVRGHKLEVQRITGTNAGAPTIVFLHEGLGSISLWRDFPARIVARTGCSAVVYSRYGYGKSDVLQEARDVRFMHEEALEVLPELLEKLAIREPILIGHSDGGSIAIIYAGAGNPVRGLVLMAPHVFGEEWGLKSIAEAKIAFETTDLPQKLGKHHTDAAKTFWGWNDVWLLPEFRSWNIEEYLPRITCPVLAIQGFEDQYGTMAQLDAIVAKVGGPVETLRLRDCKHSPHRDQPEAVIEAISHFLSAVKGN
jgi:pimeloyl-ACP methyl ester carboxylesterase